MSEYSTGPTPGPADDQPSTDLSVYFSAEQLAELEQAMQAEAALTETGRAGATVGTLIEPTPAKAGWVTESARRALPDWAANKETLLGAVRQARAEATYRLVFHTLRTPAYAARIALLAGRGAWVAPRNAVHFFLAGEYNDGIKSSKKARDHAQVLALRTEKAAVSKQRMHSKRHLAAAGASGVYVLLAVLTAAAGAWIVAGPMLTVLAGVLAVVGHRDRASANPEFHLLDQAPADAGPVTDSRIITALETAGLLKDSVKALPVGPGHRLPDGSAIHLYDLTGGLTADKVAGKKKEIAGILRLPADQIDIRRGEHESQVSIWTATKNPFKDGKTSPLFGKAGKIQPTDVWNVGIPVGFDQRGNTVYLRLRHVMALLGGMSQTGKGMLLRSIISGLALDPNTNIRLVSGAKLAELLPFAPTCATFFGGRDTKRRLVELLRAFLAEAVRRDDHMTEHNITRFSEASLATFPLDLLIIDEAQRYTDDDEIRALLEEISDFAASLNMTVLLVTQDPDDKAIPTGFNKNVKSRVATRTANAKQTNAILGDRATGMGLVAHELPVSIPGMTIVDTPDAPGTLMRSYFLEDRKFDATAPLIEAAVEFRRAANRLPGQFEDRIEAHLIEVFGTTSAAGGARGMGKPTPAVRGILAVLLAVFADQADPERLTVGDVAGVLASRDPGTWSAKALGLAEDADAATLNRAVGTRLRKEIDTALEGSGRTLKTEQKQDPRTKSNAAFYYLAAIKAAAGLS